MRFKVSNSECVHLWANQTQSHSEGPTVFFADKTIYSYGSHFPMATFVEGTKKRSAVIVTTRTYSKTTGGHLADVRYAINHLTSFHVPFAGPLHWTKENKRATVKACVSFYKQEIRERINKASRARSNREWYLREARQLTNESNQLCEFFGVRSRLTLPDTFEEMLQKAREEQQQATAAQRKIAIAREKAREEQERKAIAEAMEILPRWREGAANFLPHVIGTRLRLTDNGNTIQTSRGAIFPTEHGHKAFRLLFRLYKRHQTYLRNGHTIHCGHYKIDRMDSEFIVAGCHKIEWEEMLDFAHLAGWIDADNNLTSGHQTDDSGPDASAGMVTVQDSGEVQS